jgi:hypothetical protein
LVVVSGGYHHNNEWVDKGVHIMLSFNAGE